MSGEPSSKRVKLSERSSLNRDISPPPLRRQAVASNDASSSTEPASDTNVPKISQTPPKSKLDIPSSDTLIISSPFRLTRIRDFPENKNIDTITITDILGNPLIREIWSFNFMHDLEWMVSHLDEDTGSSIDIKVIHGNWKRDDPSRRQLEAEKEKLTADGSFKIELITAFLPDPFGTHHTKMLVLFYHDDTAEVVIHTANMIPWDWSNMTQAVWRSPKLPLLRDDTTEKKEGVGWSFKEGLMAYIGAYGWRTEKLAKQLRMYDFRDVRAIFIGHVPGEHPINGPENKLFGWGKTKRVLMKVGRGGGHGVNKAGRAIFHVKGHGEMVMQCSSVGTLGQPYFDDVIYPTFSTCRPNGGGPVNAFQALRSPGSQAFKSTARPNFALVFPSVDNVRQSVSGWQGGSPIFMKGGKPPAIAQIKYLRPMLAVWGQPPIGITSNILVEAERGKATPHIKTYNHFSPPRVDAKGEEATTGKREEEESFAPPGFVAMDWAMITSANLSKQAWGNPAKGNTSKIQSYEAGVMIHPGLFKGLLKDDEGYVQMFAVGGKDWIGDDGEQVRAEDLRETMDGKWRMVKVGVRLPYDYPLKKYEKTDEPWCRDEEYGQLRDWKGTRWPPTFEDILRAHVGTHGDDLDEVEDEL
ncbi:hypothetical protein Dda_6663 [Drechslerella dactyloides]|uniref:Phospholipase D/nuclease n=1 Tax=Drechslerella dactyloides TaxID=74499 RepID=A0AAD6IXV1_DREDA|nr:hypothetical protein Dda_6663 [Drechslerella dactyloides]